eukprot:scaffold287272_cov24-Tisochrysis_lutea.AAC.2
MLWRRTASVSRPRLPERMMVQQPRSIAGSTQAPTGPPRQGHCRVPSENPLSVAWGAKAHQRSAALRPACRADVPPRVRETRLN